MVKKAIIAGHICLDIIPAVDHHFELQPGHLYEVGAPLMATGGAVSNTGIALHILGIPVTLMGKLGDDSFGKTILQIVQERATGLEKGFLIDRKASTSYTVVINIPGIDRIFLHSPGANADFGADDIDYDKVKQAALFHFGYPSFMARTYADGARELLEMFHRVKACGVTTSLDPGMPDGNGPAGKVDWPHVLQELLPNVDVFMPSADELLFLLEPEKFSKGDDLSPAELSRLGQRMLDLGVGIAAIKLGKRGLYLRTGTSQRLQKMGAGCPDNVVAWADRELCFPIFKEEQFKGATGAGDTTIAGFLASLLHSLTPEMAGTFACAVGACNVEAPDALGGIRSWQQTRERIQQGWAKIPFFVQEKGWRQDAEFFWYGPNDAH
ncbi:MAG: carbohydrate kinase family protein [Lentisphaeria bacterium]